MVLAHLQDVFGAIPGTFPPKHHVSRPSFWTESVGDGSYG